MLAQFTPKVFVTKAIVALNILVFVAMVAAGVSFMAPTGADGIEWGANFGPKTLNGQWWRLLTSLFLHFGIIHLAFNMYILWAIGPLVERFVGNVGYALLYIVSGLAGSMASLWWNPVAISAGASGAVFGVAGATLGMLLLRRDTVPPDVMQMLRKNMTNFVVLNVVLGFAVPRVDMAAHLGGLIGGFLLGLVLSQPFRPEMVERRKTRNLIAAILSVIALPLASLALPEAPPDFQAVMQRFLDVEENVIATHNRLVEELNSETIDPSQFADEIDSKILPQWTASRKEVDELLASPFAEGEGLERIAKYIQLREDSWRLRAEGIRENDWAKLDQADTKWEEAEKVANDGEE